MVQQFLVMFQHVVVSWGYFSSICRCFSDMSGDASEVSGYVSVAYTMNVMYYEWMEKPVDGDSDVSLPQFVLEDVLQSDCSKNYTSGKGHQAFSVSAAA